MQHWNLVRLELARTADFPHGSASRAFMLRVPLDEQGLIDGAALARRPGMATVRRFWPNEADQTGHLVRNGKGWVFSYAVGEGDDEKLYHLQDHPLRVGDYVTLSEPDGSSFPFRVVRSQADGVSGA
jgi:hypothetical protein